MHRIDFPAELQNIQVKWILPLSRGVRKGRRDTLDPSKAPTLLAPPTQCLAHALGGGRFGFRCHMLQVRPVKARHATQILPYSYGPTNQAIATAARQRWSLKERRTEAWVTLPLMHQQLALGGCRKQADVNVSVWDGRLLPVSDYAVLNWPDTRAARDEAMKLSILWGRQWAGLDENLLFSKMVSLSGAPRSSILYHWVKQLIENAVSDEAHTEAFIRTAVDPETTRFIRGALDCGFKPVEGWESATARHRKGQT